MLRCAWFESTHLCIRSGWRPAIGPEKRVQLLKRQSLRGFLNKALPIFAVTLAMVFLAGCPWPGAENSAGPSESASKKADTPGSSAGLSSGRVTIEGDSHEVIIGRIIGLRATSTDERDRITWSSDNKSIATVDRNGVVRGVAIGSTQITAQGNRTLRKGRTTVYVRPTEDNALLLDAEGELQADWGQRNTEHPYRGAASFECNPDPWRSPSVSVLESAWRKDLSGFDEIWLFAKSDTPGAHASLTIHMWPKQSNTVEFAPYVKGGPLDEQYRLVRIPTAALKSGTFGLTGIERMSFGATLPGENYRVFIDDIWAVHLGNVKNGAVPVIGPLPDTDFGPTPLHTPVPHALSVTNIGLATLEVSSVSLSGQDASAFTAFPGTFSVAPGESQTVFVSFQPATAGPLGAVMTLTHNETVSGTATSVVLTGMGIGPRLVVSSSYIELGRVPVGLSADQFIGVTNDGNEALEVSIPNAPNAPFAVTPASLSLAEGEHGVLTVTGTPESIGDFNADLVLHTNVLGAESKTIGLHVEGIDASEAGSLPLSVADVSSSSFDLSWTRIPGASGVRVVIGPEPAATRDTVLPLEYEVANLPGDATQFRLSNLSAATDVFVRVEVLANGQIVTERNAHVRTPGGPKAPIDTPLREAHMAAPNIIQLVLSDLRVHSYSPSDDSFDGGLDEVIGDRGARWQAGPWQVERADGTPIPVTGVHRSSTPAGQNYYEVGFGKNTNNQLLDVDHAIYLVLAEPVGSPEVLRIVGPSFDYEVLTPDRTRETVHSSLSVLLPFSDRYLETPSIQVNQVGYSPRATRRWAYICGYMGDGGPLPLDGFPANAEVIQEQDNPLDARTVVAADLPIAPRSAFDPDSGSAVDEIDLKTLPASETVTYRVRVPGVGVSWPTRVSEAAVHESYYKVARGLFHNRWAGDLRPDLTEWSRPQDHLTVYTSESDDPYLFFSANTPLTGERFLLGGYHDAGDFDIRLFHRYIPLFLLRTYEVTPDSFTDGQLNLPESGNGIPDMLDEALWGVACWEYLQEEDGGVRMGAESFRHPLGIYLAHEDELPYWTYSCEPKHTMFVAGLFAQASRLVAPYDAQRAKALKRRALAAYNYALLNGITPDYGGPIMYAAGELFHLTGEQRFYDTIVDTWETWRPPFHQMPMFFDRDVPPTEAILANREPIMWDQVLGYLQSPGVAPEHLAPALAALDAAPARILDAIETNHAHRNGRPIEFIPSWGKGTSVGQYLFSVYAAAQVSGQIGPRAQEQYDAVSLSADYILGCNPLGRVWLTGLGSRPPLDPLHNDSLAFMREGKGPIPGIPVYGPVIDYPNVDYYDHPLNVSYPAMEQLPPLRRFGDAHFLVESNEFTVMDMQAPSVELFAMLYGLRPE
ncbi:MAG: choice-of-anchor D domain-containing protein [Candidatus Hydrogenedentes bacterium]|nr:choice-of-anchor D domain-containing protein [Candidatus Hydrogenedentota bacterium]